MKRRRSKRLYTAGGVTQTAEQWAAELGISVSAFRKRLAGGWSVQRACTLPRTDPTAEPRRTSRERWVLEGKLVKRARALGREEARVQRRHLTNVFADSLAGDLARMRVWRRLRRENPQVPRTELVLAISEALDP